ncbi:zinc finger, CCHC-type, retrotransposon gag domain protein [Tanacetum coccineum]|uniref:Zinc finger, CCHC-type, retrotransposon gag domain protein n=1 Tax=Tanacetum coccineum TaxID=301880 RepID=A0ABQ5E2F3_9ASTR
MQKLKETDVATKDIFEISECSPRQRVKYASHLLKGEARHWWSMIKIARGDDVASVMTWDEFEDLVMENYYPQRLMNKLEEELLKLQQNDMTVLKYMAKFNEKARFAKYQVATEENNRQLEEGGDNKIKRENHDDDMKKIKISGEKTDNTSEYKPCKICNKTHRRKCRHEDSRNCGKPGHATKDCKADWVCFRSKKSGHKIVDCSERNPQDPQEKTGYCGNRVEYKDTQPRKTTGRVFQLTTEKAQDTSTKKWPVTKGELGNEIKRIVSEHLPTILAQSQENFRKAKEARIATEEVEKKKKANEEAKRRRKEMEDKRAAEESSRIRYGSYIVFLNCKLANFTSEIVTREMVTKRLTGDRRHIQLVNASNGTSQRLKFASLLLKREACPVGGYDRDSSS